jgi:hypothetical protein
MTLDGVIAPIRSPFVSAASAARRRGTAWLACLLLFVGVLAPQILWSGHSAATTVAHWTVTSTPDQPSANNQLLSLARPATGSCVAVGFTGTGPDEQRTLIETLSGGTWHIESTPNVPSSDDVLSSVSCLAVGNCVAVGVSDVNDSAANDETLIETLKAGHWSITPSPNPGTDGDVLEGVSCAKPTTCIAVGYSGYSGSKTVIESTSGASWSETRTGNGSSGILSAVSCSKLGSCVAVGTVAATLSGVTWSVGAFVQPNPSQRQEAGDLAGISCIPTGCIAVGEYYSNPSLERWSTLIERLSGGSWHIESSPTVGSDSYLSGVACSALTSCTAVGYSLNTPIFPQVSSTLVVGLTSAGWSTEPSPDPAGTSKSDLNRLEGVKCSAVETCEAVGWSLAASGFYERTLAMRSTP